ncbi:MAG: class I SAM-dependent rRNA methyltransferase [Bryobacteraceae bacterium]|nr:class I SAM-dependent rRNA methyltransferase [Bryobacteraceae bacterium]
MTPSLPAVRISRKGANRLRSGHPWVFAGDLLDEKQAAPGDVVQVLDERNRSLGVAHYSAASQIRLRLLSGRLEEVDAAFLRRRIEAAAHYRSTIVTGTDAYRLVYSEADRLPGLIVDCYGDCLVMQTLDQGMDRIRNELAGLLEEITRASNVVLRNDVAVRKKEGLVLERAVLKGEVPERVPVRMNGIAMHADLLGGQKTGIYLDQRENYAAAASYAGGRALDCFTSTGGFALHLAQRCESVLAVDSSGEALAAAKGNAEANGLRNVEFREADVFDFLSAQVLAGRGYSTIVLDPPAFAKTRGALTGAARGYKEINYRALRLLRPGGILITCSCSHHFSEAAFLEVLAAASLDAGCTIRILERRTQARDHPILLTVPETHYLKCLILQVL